LLGSSDPAMRRAVLTAFGKFGDPRAVDILTGVLESGDVETQVLAIQGLGKLRALQAAPRLLDLLQDNQLFGPHAGIHRAVCDAFQEFSGIKKNLADAFPRNSKPLFNIAGAQTDLAGMMGILGNDGFQKLNQALSEMESRAGEASKKSNLPPEAMQNMMDQTWKFGAMFADAHDAKVAQVKSLIELLNSESPLIRTAAVLSLPWYMDAQILDHIEDAMQDEDEMVKRASTWAYTMLKKMFP